MSGHGDLHLRRIRMKSDDTTITTASTPTAKGITGGRGGVGVGSIDVLPSEEKCHIKVYPTKS